LHDAWLTGRIRAIHEASKGRYGSPRVHAMLRRDGIRVGEKRVARLMRLAGLQGAHRRRRKGCTVGVEGVEPFGDLVGRDFRPDAPNRVWAADIKQIKTGEGWLYLAAVQDLYSRRIVGWAMAPHMRQELVIDALRMAVKARRPGKGTIHPSDHGGQFIGLTFGQACHDAGIAQSMGAVGSCFDNAVVAADRRGHRALEALGASCSPPIAPSLHSLVTRGRARCPPACIVHRVGTSGASRAPRSWLRPPNGAARGFTRDVSHIGKWTQSGPPRPSCLGFRRVCVVARRLPAQLRI
jgi:putative transposase